MLDALLDTLGLLAVLASIAAHLSFARTWIPGLRADTKRQAAHGAETPHACAGSCQGVMSLGDSPDARCANVQGIFRRRADTMHLNVKQPACVCRCPSSMHSSKPVAAIWT